MILQQILEALDGELERLHQLREIVLGLARPSILPASSKPAVLSGLLATEAGRSKKEKKEEAAEGQAPSRKSAKQTRGRPRAAGETRGRRRTSAAVPESSALRGIIPNGPVVVPASQIPSRSSKPAKRVAAGAKMDRRETSALNAALQPSEREVGSLGSMIRALRLGTP